MGDTGGFQGRDGPRARLERAVAALYRLLGRHRLTRTPWRVVQTFSKADGALLSGSMAYYTFLSLLPLLMVAGFVVGTISSGDAELRSALEEAIERQVPAVSGSDLMAQLVGSRATFGLLGLVTVVYAGSGFVGALTACLNRMWDVSAGRNPIGQKVVNLVAVVVLGTVLVGSMTVTLSAAYLARETLGPDGGPLAASLRLASSPLAVFLTLAVLYRVLPARRLSWTSQLPGALLGAVAIEVLRRGFAYWASHSAGVGVLPRSLVSVVLLLVWLGFVSQAILYGAALNVVLRQSSGRRRHRLSSGVHDRQRLGRPASVGGVGERLPGRSPWTRSAREPL